MDGCWSLGFAVTLLSPFVTTVCAPFASWSALGATVTLLSLFEVALWSAIVWPWLPLGWVDGCCSLGFAVGVSVCVPGCCSSWLGVVEGSVDGLLPSTGLTLWPGWSVGSVGVVVWSWPGLTTGLSGWDGVTATKTCKFILTVVVEPSGNVTRTSSLWSPTKLASRLTFCGWLHLAVVPVGIVSSFEAAICKKTPITRLWVGSLAIGLAISGLTILLISCAWMVWSLMATESP